jgi:nucleoside-diphosphate-sugar epimerase
MKKILITGANGFLGNIIFQTLCQEFEVTKLDVTSKDERKDLSKTVPSINDDFDIVVHAAGKAHTYSEKDPAVSDTNVTGTKNLLAAFENCLPKTFVLISSVSVYGKDVGIDISEEQLPAPQNIYGQSKLSAEQLVLNWHERTHVPCIILRLPLIVGKRPPGNLGAMINAIQKGFYFKIGRTNPKKSVVLAEDVAKCIPTLFMKNGIFNLTDGHHPTINELCDTIAASYNKRNPMVLPFFLARLISFAGDVLPFVPLNSQKLTKMTGSLTFCDKKAREALEWSSRRAVDYITKNTL